MARSVLCKLADLAVGRLTPVTMGRTKLVLALLPDGTVSAFAARCPHQGADLDHGQVADLVGGEALNEIRADRPAEVLRCPWHGFEFCLRSGSPLVPEPAWRRMRLRRYDVAIEGDCVVIVR